MLVRYGLERVLYDGMNRGNVCVTIYVPYYYCLFCLFQFYRMAETFGFIKSSPVSNISSP
jgi:hypothetical protein